MQNISALFQNDTLPCHPNANDNDCPATVKRLFDLFGSAVGSRFGAASNRVLSVQDVVFPAVDGTQDRAVLKIGKPYTLPNSIMSTLFKSAVLSVEDGVLDYSIAELECRYAGSKSAGDPFEHSATECSLFLIEDTPGFRSEVEITRNVDLNGRLSQKCEESESNNGQRTSPTLCRVENMPRFEYFLKNNIHSKTRIMGHGATNILPNFPPTPPTANWAISWIGYPMGSAIGIFAIFEALAAYRAYTQTNPGSGKKSELTENEKQEAQKRAQDHTKKAAGLALLSLGVLFSTYQLS